MRLLFITLANLILISCTNPDVDNATTDLVDSLPTENIITITAVGDMMLGSDYPDSTKLPKRNILLYLADSLKTGDFTIGNLEGVITNVAKPEKVCTDPKKCYAFRMPLEFADFFKTGGFDFLNLANNHSGDFGNMGLIQTMKYLKEAGIRYAGIKPRHEYSIITKNGTRFGIIGAGFGWRHPHINNTTHINQLIHKIRDSTDILIVYFHGGAEGDTSERVTRNAEFFHGEPRGNVYSFAHNCIDTGADLVLGSGPHVCRGIELYKNKLIAYSLGNYATYGKISLRGPMGIAPILKIIINKKGDFVKGRIISTQQQPLNDQGPVPDAAKKAILRIKRLSKQDFPESPLNFSATGEIIKNF